MRRRMSGRALFAESASNARDQLVTDRPASPLSSLLRHCRTVARRAVIKSPFALCGGARPPAWGHITTASAPATPGAGIRHDEVVPESRRPAVGVDALAVWCMRWLGAPPAAELFEAGYLSTVKGLLLADGREVVVKVRPRGPRLAGCAAVHRALWAAGFPCPQPLVDLQPLAGYAATAEMLVLDASEPPPDSELAALSAAALARLVELAPDPGSVPSLAPSPSWAGWDHTEPGLWPEPEDRDVDLNACPEPRWLDRVAAAVRDRLRGHTSDLVIGHGDWHPENLRWHGPHLIAVHDWDSVICQPEPAIAGPTGLLR